MFNACVIGGAITRPIFHSPVQSQLVETAAGRYNAPQHPCLAGQAQPARAYRWVVTLVVWAYYGSAVFFEMIAADFRACL